MIRKIFDAIYFEGLKILMSNMVWDMVGAFILGAATMLGVILYFWEIT